MDWIDYLQWPAMVLSIAAAWYVASTSDFRRRLGFWLFLASNVVWTAWGLYTDAYALIALQFMLAAMNIRGAYKTSRELARES
ncbi:Amino acid transporter [Burkholderiales bacterium 8X]|nr:Amino acid transporter [Burkholderiales bacterium 8X]